MTKRESRPRPPRTPRLYLLTPVLSDAAPFLPALQEAMIAGADVAVVLLRLTAASERDLINRARSVAPIIQGAGAALLIENPDLVARTGADGVHLGSGDAVPDALAALKPDRIVGVGGLQSRHEAMLAGEAGADYLLFGAPEPDGSRAPFESVLEQVGWWAELFEVPCVGFAETFDEVDALVAARAEFVAAADLVWRAGQPAHALLQIAHRLTVLEKTE